MAKVKIEEFKGYCLKCKKKRNVEGKYRETSDGKRGMLQGECPKCGTTVSRITALRD